LVANFFVPAKISFAGNTTLTCHVKIVVALLVLPDISSAVQSIVVGTKEIPQTPHVVNNVFTVFDV